MMRFGFMTSVAPRWNLDQIIAAAQDHDCQAIEVRVEWGHAVGIELETSKEIRRDARQKLADANVAVASLALGTRFAQSTPEERTASVEQVARYAELAADLGAPVLRVFGGKVPKGTTVADLRDVAAEALGQAAVLAADFGVTPCLETHDDFSNPTDVAYVVDQANHPNVGVVWHASHHLQLGIPVADGYRTLRPWVRHVHVNEGHQTGAELSSNGPEIFGAVDGNVAEVVRTLKANEYRGTVCWEWLNGQRDKYIDPGPGIARNVEQFRVYEANQ